MQPHVVYPHQSRLKNKKRQPSVKNKRMDVNDWGGAVFGWMIRAPIVRLKPYTTTTVINNDIAK